MTALRSDLAAIADDIATGERVLDVGCGDGALMAALRDTKGVDVRGLELDAPKVAACVARGLSVVQGDAETDLAAYPDHSFDVAILSQTLQTTQHPDRVIADMLRVARRGYVSFPNFAHWRVRGALLWRGRMPVTRALPVDWYATPNIHHLTIADFHDFARSHGYAIERAWYLVDGRPCGAWRANWAADQAVFRLRRATPNAPPVPTRA